MTNSISLYNSCEDAPYTEPWKIRGRVVSAGKFNMSPQRRQVFYEAYKQFGTQWFHPSMLMSLRGDSQKRIHLNELFLANLLDKERYNRLFVYKISDTGNAFFGAICVPGHGVNLSDWWEAHDRRNN